MNRIYAKLLLFCLICLVPSKVYAEAEVHLSIFKDVKKKIAIALPEFQLKGVESLTDAAADEGAEILKNDLNLSGIFDIIINSKSNRINRLDLSVDAIHYDEWSDMGAHAMVRGEYTSSADGITIKLSLYDIAKKRYLVGKRYRGKKQHLRQIMHKFADEVVFQLTGEKGIAQTKLLFASVKSGHKELFVVEYDGYEKSLNQLTKEQSLVLFPAWSPTGKRVVYTAFKNNSPYLKILNLENGKSKVISNAPGLNANPAWSPDGSKIVFTSSRDGNPEIYLLDEAGNFKRLTNFRGVDTSPTWSPDGKKIAFTSDRSGSPQIYIMDSGIGESKMIKRITFKGSYNDQPAWSPKGDKIAFSSLINNRFQIIVKDLKSRKELQLTKKGSSKETPTWSPNGRFLAFSSNLTGESAIYVVQANGPGLRRLTFLKGGGFFPAWSPILN